MTDRTHPAGGRILPIVLSRAVATVGRIFGVLREPELGAPWFADWVSDVGNFITFVAPAVYVHDLTGSATAVGFALALTEAPRFLIGPFGGLLADRMDRRGS